MTTHELQRFGQNCTCAQIAPFLTPVSDKMYTGAVAGSVNYTQTYSTVNKWSPSFTQAPDHHTNKATLFTSPRTSFLGKANRKSPTVSSLSSGSIKIRQKRFKRSRASIENVYSRFHRFKGTCRRIYQRERKLSHEPRLLCVQSKTETYNRRESQSQQ